MMNDDAKIQKYLQKKHIGRKYKKLFTYQAHNSEILSKFAQDKLNKTYDMAILHPINIPQSTPLPTKMNNPLDYKPHALCRMACLELQEFLSKEEEWREEINKGKMFGVLIVEKDGQLAYLTAYSGQIGGRSDWPDFVPAVFDYLQPDGYFKTHEAEITRINHAIASMEKDERMVAAQEQVRLLEEKRKEIINSFQQQMKAAKARRDERRKSQSLTKEENQELIRESQFMKAELKRLKKSLSEKTTLEQEYMAWEEDLKRLKQLRKQLSDALQQWLFGQFKMLNPKGEERSLTEIFASTAAHIPPAGSGECCEPKLLQYAYQHHLRPLQMAMFWWGESPKEEIRHHLHFYPACNGKCKPILQWMLPDITKGNEDIPIYNNVEDSSGIEFIYEDNEIAVICKPAGLLSVPGKDGGPSVFSLMKRKYPHATGPLVVHRLDMATSGLMVIAKTDFAYRQLQQQFSNHTVKKRYVAIVCGAAFPPKGTISLPLAPNFLDRPRQTVNYDNGKEAVTDYEATEEIYDIKGETLNPNVSHMRLALFPHTGRTHQLRVHCAHKQGLNAPILGDPLYGNEEASRLYLHAEAIRFRHPLTDKEMTFERKADF